MFPGQLFAQLHENYLTKVPGVSGYYNHYPGIRRPIPKPRHRNTTTNQSSSVLRLLSGRSRPTRKSKFSSNSPQRGSSPARGETRLLSFPESIRMTYLPVFRRVGNLGNHRHRSYTPPDTRSSSVQYPCFFYSRILNKLGGEREFLSFFLLSL